MHQMFNTGKTATRSENEGRAPHEVVGIDDDWQVVASSSKTTSEPSKDAQKQGSQSEQSRGPFLPLTEAAATRESSKSSYAAKLKTGLAEHAATTAAIDQLTASVKAQSTDLVNAVKKLNQERELLAKERKRLQDKNIAEQAEIHAQLNRQVIAMHHAVIAKVGEEKQKLHNQLKEDFDEDLTRVAKDIQDALDAEAKIRRSLLEELNDWIQEAKKALEMRVSVVEQQFRGLQQHLSSMDQRISGIEQHLRPSSQDRASRSSQPGYSQERRSGVPSQQNRSTGSALRSRMDVNAANAAAQSQRAEGPERGTGVSQATQRAHAMHVARGQFDCDCELCA